MPSRKGSPNRPKRQLLALLQEQYPGYQPVVSMAQAACRITALAEKAESLATIPPEATEELTDEDMSQTTEHQLAVLWEKAGAAHDRVAKYVTPQLKAIDHTGIGVNVVRIKDLSGGKRRK